MSGILLGQPVRYAFIDSQNLNLAIRSQGWKLDYARFRRYLLDKYKIQKAFLFIGYLAKNEPLYTLLQTAGFVLVFKPTMVLPNGLVKGNVDAELVLHAMIEWERYHEAVVVTGDGDFACLIQHLVENGKLCRLLVPNARAYSGLLKAVAVGRIDFMNNLQKKLSKTQRGPITSGQNPMNLPSS